VKHLGANQQSPSNDRSMLDHCGDEPSVTSKCPTNVISDDPALNDYFDSNKAYQRVVDAILDLIRSDPEAGGISIGLEGQWGTGKTTIINLLRKKIDETREIGEGDSTKRTKGNEILIMFDAWAHEGDPLRLTFLETLVERMKGEAWICTNKWEEQLDLIAQRREIKSTSTDFNLKLAQIIIGSCFFLIPIGIALLSVAFRENITFVPDQHLPVAWRLVFGLLLAVAPLIAIMLHWVWSILKRTLSSKKESLEKQVNRRPSLLPMLLNKAITEDKTVITKTPNPTSLEFEKKFKELMNDALDGHPERRVVLVIDNLDRIPSEQALAIWSTIQPFLQYSNYNPPAWQKQFYLLVPYDPKVINVPWEKEKSNSSRGGRQREIGNCYVADLNLFSYKRPLSSERNNDSNQSDFAASFLDKIFQVRFEVPSPVLSDWRQYLIHLLTKALPGHMKKPEEYHVVYRVLAIHMTLHKRMPAIRELKIFVNQIGVAHRQWGDAFPLCHLAYYVLLRWRGKDVVRGLLDGDFPEKDYTDILDANVRESLAALTFNVEKKIAYQLLLNNPLKDVLARRDASELKKLAKFDIGFWETLEHIISTELVKDGDKIANAAYCLDQSGLLGAVNRHEVRNIINSLCNLVSNLNSWPLFDMEKAEGIAILCRWKLNDSGNGEVSRNYVVGLLKAITEGLFDRTNSRAREVDVQKWIEALQLVLHAVRPFDLLGVDLKIVVEAIKERLEPCIYLGRAEARTLFETLYEMGHIDDRANEPLIALAQEGQILHYLQQFLAGEKDVVVATWCVFILLRYAPGAPGKEGLGNSVYGRRALDEMLKAPDLGIVKEFTKILARDREFRVSWMSKMLKQAPSSNILLTFCLKQLTDNTTTIPLSEDESRLLISHIEGVIKKPPSDN
jgi:KAP family P-loop domain